MPNYVRNILVPKDETKLKDLLVNEKGEIDFNKLIPRPKDLDIASSTYLWKSASKWSSVSEINFQDFYLELPLQKIYGRHHASQEEFVKFALKNDSIKQNICKLFSHFKPKEEDIKNYLASFYNLSKYGCTDWYDWSCVKWGTKWNACGTYCAGESYDFDTAWSTPLGIWQELAKHTDFVVLYADEDEGNNCGYIIAENGKIEHTSLDRDVQSYLFAEMVWHGGSEIEIEEIDEWATEQWGNITDDDLVAIASTFDSVYDHWK